MHSDTSSAKTGKRYTPALAYKQDYINLDNAQGQWTQFARTNKKSNDSDGFYAFMLASVSLLDDESRNNDLIGLIAWKIKAS